MRPVLLFLLAGALACASPFGGAPTFTPPETSTRKVGLAVEIAAEVKKDPDQAQAALERRGMTEEHLEALMADIAADPEMSEAYAKARGK